MKQGPEMTAALRTRRGLKTSQEYHTYNRTDKHPELMCPAVHFLLMPLMKRKIFRVGRSKHHSLRNGYGSLCLTEVQYTNLVGAPGRTKTMKRRI